MVIAKCMDEVFMIFPFWLWRRRKEIVGADVCRFAGQGGKVRGQIILVLAAGDDESQVLMILQTVDDGRFFFLGVEIFFCPNGVALLCRIFIGLSG